MLVACVLWVGDFEGRHYGVDDVLRLRSMVAKNLSIAHDFACLSNVDVPGVTTIPLRTDWPGWWAKLEVFKLLTDRVMVLDLDLVIVGSLDDLPTFNAPMVFAPAMINKPKPGIVRRYNTSCFVFSPPEGDWLYERFVYSRHGAMFRGDQDYIGYYAPSYATFPSAWFAKLHDCPDGPPEGAKIVLSHQKHRDGKDYAWRRNFSEPPA